MRTEQTRSETIAITVPRERTQRTTLSHASVLGILALFTFLGFYNLGAKSMWVDEAFSMAFISMTWSELLYFWWNQEANMGLYYVTLKLWTSIFGTSEIAARSLSVFFAVGTIWATWRVGLKLFGPRTALLAALILSVNVTFLAYTQQARAYTMATFFAMLATLCFLRAVERSELRNWLLYTVVVAAGIYAAHFFLALVPIAHLAALLATRWQAVPWRHLIPSGVAGGILLSPLLAYLARRGDDPLWWVTERGWDIAPYFFYFLVDWNFWLLTTYFVAIWSAVLWFGQKYPRHTGLKLLWPFALIVSLFLIPIALALVLEVAVRPVFVPRYLLFCLPPLALLVAVGLTHIRPRGLSTAVLAIIVLLSLPGLSGYYEHYHRDDIPADNWRGVTQHVLIHANPNDAVIFHVPFTRVAYDYYVERLATEPVPQVVFPVWSDIRYVYRDPLPPELLRAVPRQYETTWLVLRYDDGEHIQAALAANYNEVWEQQFAEIRVLQYTHSER